MREVTPATLKELILDVAKMKDPPVIMVWGKPGIGKTYSIQDAAKALGYEYLPLSLGRVERVDLNGAVSKSKIKDEDGTEREYTVFSPPLLYKTIFDKKGKVVFHLDEFTGAEPEVQNACLDMVLEKRIDTLKFPKDLIIIISGNLGDDGTFASSVTTALSSRGIVTLMKQPSVKEWLVYENANRGVSPWIEGFLENFAEHFNPGPKLGEPHKAWSCPRTWSLLNNLLLDLKVEDPDKVKQHAEGLMGEGTFNKFADYVDDNSVNIEKLITGDKKEWDRMKKLPATRRVTVYKDIVTFMGKGKMSTEQSIKIAQKVFDSMLSLDEVKDNIIAFAQELSVHERKTLNACYYGEGAERKKVGFLFDEIKK